MTPPLTPYSGCMRMASRRSSICHPIRPTNTRRFSAPWRQSSLNAARISACPLRGSSVPTISEKGMDVSNRTVVAGLSIAILRAAQFLQGVNLGCGRHRFQRASARKNIAMIVEPETSEPRAAATLYRSCATSASGVRATDMPGAGTASIDAAQGTARGG